MFLFSISGHWEEEYQGATGVVAAAVSIKVSEWPGWWCYWGPGGRYHTDTTEISFLTPGTSREGETLELVFL